MALSKKIKKYKMRGISPLLSEKGGYTAVFLSDGYILDGKAEILPKVLKDGGMKVSPGVAWDIIHNYLTECAQHTASTGETVNAGDLLVTLSIRGWYANKDSVAPKENVRVGIRMCSDLRPTVSFSMSNELQGRTLMLYSATTPGHELNHVGQASVARINGNWTKILDGDTVIASMKDSSRQTVTAECQVTDSEDDRIDIVVPAAFDGAEFVGKEITFTVTSRCGLEDMSSQVKSISATLDKGDGDAEPESESEPETVPTIKSVNDGSFHSGGGNVVTGVGMRFQDAFPGNHLVIRNSEGDDMGAMISTDESVPVTETRFALLIDEGIGLVDGEEYVFVFEMLDAEGEPVTVTCTARWRAD